MKAVKALCVHKAPCVGRVQPAALEAGEGRASESLNESIHRDYSAGFQVCIEYSVKEIDLGKSLFPDSGSVLFKVDCLHKGCVSLIEKVNFQNIRSKVLHQVIRI